MSKSNEGITPPWIITIPANLRSKPAARPSKALELHEKVLQSDPQQQTIWAPIVSGMSHGRSRVSHPYSASERASLATKTFPFMYVLIRSARAHLESAPERGGWERRFKGRKWQLRKVQNVWDGAGKSSGAARRVFLPQRSWDLRLVLLRAHLLAHNTRKGHGSPAAAAKFALNSAGFGCDSAASRDENQQVNTHSHSYDRRGERGRGGVPAERAALLPPLRAGVVHEHRRPRSPPMSIPRIQLICFHNFCLSHRMILNN